MMSNVIEQARELKSDAMEARDEGDFGLADELIGEAVGKLRGALEELKGSRENPAHPGEFETKVANQLVHILGSKGGIYRRRARDLSRRGDAEGSIEAAEKSIRAYDAGYLEFERAGAGYGLVNSYTLVQRLVARVLKEPGSVAEGYPPVNGVRVRSELLNALEEIQKQRDSPRKEDAYAAADHAFVCILLGSKDWSSNLDDFVNFSPPPEQYAIDVTCELLGELRDTLSESADALPDLLKRLSDAYEKLVPHSSGR